MNAFKNKEKISSNVGNYKIVVNVSTVSGNESALFYSLRNTGCFQLKDHCFGRPGERRSGRNVVMFGGGAVIELANTNTAGASNGRTMSRQLDLEMDMEMHMDSTQLLPVTDSSLPRVKVWR